MSRRRRRDAPVWAIGAGAAAVVAAGAAAAARFGLLKRASALPEAAAEAVPDAVQEKLPDTVTKKLPDAVTEKRPGQADAGTADADAPLGEPWTCQCGQAFMVAGRDRHRVYWLEDSGPDDPVLSGHCPNCDRPLPSESGLAST
jgi:hypothetical protein